MSDVTQILEAAAAGDQQAAADLLPLVYDALRKLAAARLSAEKPGQTLQATALVHEAYLRLVANPGREPGGDAAAPPPDLRPGFANRAHFFATAAEAMRRILIDNARRKGRLKRGGDFQRIDLDRAVVMQSDEAADELLALNESLEALEREEPAKAELVKLRYFAGLTMEQSASVLGISLATAKRRWVVARAWLYDRLSSDSS